MSTRGRTCCLHNAKVAAALGFVLVLVVERMNDFIREKKNVCRSELLCAAAAPAASSSKG